MVITTTDPHLARRMGEALQHAHHGTFTCRYEENEDLIRVNWHCECGGASAKNLC